MMGGEKKRHSEHYLKSGKNYRNILMGNLFIYKNKPFYLDIDNITTKFCTSLLIHLLKVLYPSGSTSPGQSPRGGLGLYASPVDLVIIQSGTNVVPMDHFGNHSKLIIFMGAEVFSS